MNDFSKDGENHCDSNFKNKFLTNLKTLIISNSEPQIDDGIKNNIEEYQGYINIIFQLMNSRQSSFGITNISDNNEKGMNIELTTWSV